MMADKQLDAQQIARGSRPRSGYPFRVAHVDGRITDHRSFTLAERTWKFGDVVYQWHAERWAIWTSAGLF